MNDKGIEFILESIDKRLESINQKLDVVQSKGDICDDRSNRNEKDIKTLKVTAIKIVLALTGAGVLGGGAVEAIRALLA